MTTQWTPHSYQEEAVRFALEHANAALFLDPGLGKTACMLATLLILKEQGMFKRALVVAPLRVAKHVWPAEKTKWLDFVGLSMTVLHGPNKDKLLASLTADIAVVTPEGLEWLAANDNAGFRKLGADVLIVDESSYFRHHTSRRFRNLRGVLGRFRRRYILTGTPAPLGYHDLWTQIYLLDEGGTLGRYVTHFRQQFFYNEGRDFDVWKLRQGAEKEIDARIRPIALRGDNMDHLQMPALVYNTVAVDLPDAVIDTYRELEKRFMTILDDGTPIASPHAAALGNKLRQLANGFLYDERGNSHPQHTQKLSALLDLLHDLQGQSALILYEFVADRDAILGALPGAAVIGGGTSTTDAEKAIHGFNTGQIPYLLAHPASAGHGINLQDHANHIIWYGPTWNLEHWIQANARVWRQGQKAERVHIHTIAATDTIDERVADVLTSKDRTQKALLVALKRPLTARSSGFRFRKPQESCVVVDDGGTMLPPPREEP